MEEVLKIKVGADISEATAALKKVAADTSTSANDIAKSSTVASNAIEEIVAPITKVANSLKTLPGAVDGTARAIGTLTPITQQASGVLTAFGQSVQKATKIKVGDEYITIGKSVKELTKEFRDLEKQLTSATGKDVKRLNKELDELATIIQRVKSVGKAGFDQFGQRIKVAADNVQGASKSIATITPASQRATQALSGFSRIAQDAAFGPIAIANNIEPAILGLRNLAKESTNAKQFFGSLASSLLGGGGLALALGLLTFQMSGGLDALKQYIPGIKETAKAQKKAAEEAEKFAESQRQIAVGIKEQQLQTAELVKAARGDVGSKAEQQAALKQLNDAIPDYIGVLTEQNIKTAEGAAIVDKYTKALLQQAKAQGFLQRIAELSVKQVQGEVDAKAKLIPLFAKQEQLQKKIASQRKIEANVIGGSSTGISGGGSQRLDGDLAAVEASINDILNALQVGTKDVSREVAALEKELDKNRVVIDTSADAKDPKSKDFLKDRIAALETLKKEIGLLRIEEIELTNLKIKLNIRDAVKNGLDQGQTARLNNELSQQLDIILTAKVSLSESNLKAETDQLKAAIKGIDTTLALNGAKQGAASINVLTRSFKDLIQSLNNQAIQGGIEEIKNKIKEYRQEIKALESARTADNTEETTKKIAAIKEGIGGLNVAIIEQTGLVDVLGGVFQSTFEAALISGQSFFQTLIQGLKQMIGRLIAAAAAAAVLAGILAAVSGGSSTFGTQFFKSFKTLGGIDLGGLFGGIKAPGIGRSPQAPGVAAMGNQGGEVVFRIAGQELLGVINRTNKANSYNG